MVRECRMDVSIGKQLITCNLLIKILFVSTYLPYPLGPVSPFLLGALHLRTDDFQPDAFAQRSQMAVPVM